MCILDFFHVLQIIGMAQFCNLSIQRPWCIILLLTQWLGVSRCGGAI